MIELFFPTPDDESSARTLSSDPEERAATRDLASLLLGPALAAPELPPLGDLVAAAVALAEGTRRKVLLPLGGTPAEFALVRRGDAVLVSCYEIGRAHV